jgi:hypothetical protein
MISYTMEIVSVFSIGTALMEKPGLLLTQCTRNLEFAIGKKPLVSMR